MPGNILGDRAHFGASNSLQGLGDTEFAFSLSSDQNGLEADSSSRKRAGEKTNKYTETGPHAAQQPRMKEEGTRAVRSYPETTRKGKLNVGEPQPGQCCEGGSWLRRPTSKTGKTRTDPHTAPQLGELGKKPNPTQSTRKEGSRYGQSGNRIEIQNKHKREYELVL